MTATVTVTASRYRPAMCAGLGRGGPGIGLALVIALAAAGCDVGTSPGAASLAAASLPPDSGAPDVTDTPGASEVVGIPDFEGWHTINPQDADIGSTEAGLAMALTHRATWSGASRGVFFYTATRGDFRLSATVETSKTSDSSQEPGGDGTVQLAGLMARGSTALESWVSISAGSDADGLSVETIRTRDGSTASDGPAWPTGDATLKLCRIGTTFTFWKQPIDGSSDFSLAATEDRPDLSGELQVGADIFSDSAPDITALFTDLLVEPLDPGEAC